MIVKNRHCALNGQQLGFYNTSHQWQRQLCKIQKKWGGVGILALFFNLKVYPTDFMPFFFDNFCQILGFGEQVPQSPRGAATASNKWLEVAKNLSPEHNHRLTVKKFTVKMFQVRLG